MTEESIQKLLSISDAPTVTDLRYVPSLGAHPKTMWKSVRKYAPAFHAYPVYNIRKWWLSS